MDHSKRMAIRLRHAPQGFIFDSQRKGGCLAPLLPLLPKGWMACLPWGQQRDLVSTLTDHGQSVTPYYIGAYSSLRKEHAPAQCDVRVGPLFDPVGPIAKHEMQMVAHNGITAHLNAEEPGEGA